MESITEFEGLVALAVKGYSDDRSVVCGSSNCLSNDTLYALYKDKLPESKRKQAIGHLAGCRGCRTDLLVYSELVK
ncbi:MAG: hypothetical protein H8D47_01240 [Planctomycetes bacterium]|nr:hypothetical protein [Planctomycetota bacterium]